MERTSRRRVARWLSAAVTAASLLLAGCGDTMGPPGTGHVQVAVQGSGSTSAVLAAAALSETSYESKLASAVTLEDVASIEAEVYRVDVRRVGGGGAGGPWVSLDVADGGLIDLLALGSSGIELASGELAAGTYNGLRLFVENAVITFHETVTIGGQEYEGGTPHPLTIPSGDQTGIKTVHLSFEVEEDEQENVVLEFDADTTVRNLAVTGSGAILMNPVLSQAGG